MGAAARDAEALRRQGNAAYGQGDYRVASDCYTDALQT